MKLLLSALTAALFLACGTAHADAKADCEAKAVSKEGKPLAGAAKAAKVKKCMSESAPAAAAPAAAAPAAAAPAASANADCESKAVSKDGKPLAGAAKGAFLKKCQADANAAKK